jgi:hypothetical protein
MVEKRPSCNIGFAEQRLIVRSGFHRARWGERLGHLRRRHWGIWSRALRSRYGVNANREAQASWMRRRQRYRFHHGMLEASGGRSIRSVAGELGLRDFGLRRWVWRGSFKMIPPGRTTSVGRPVSGLLVKAFSGKGRIIVLAGSQTEWY